MTGAILLAIPLLNHTPGSSVNSAVLGITKNRAIPCLSCGYDITGLARESVCPECALPLKDTLEASALLRGWPPALVRRIRLGVFLLAMSPTCLLLGLAIGLWIGIFMAMPSQAGISEFIQGTEIGLVIGCVLGALCFVAGCELVTRVIPARPMHPPWARVTLRVTGLFAVIAAGLAPFGSLLVLNNDPWATLLIRFVSQVVVLVALASLIRVCQAIGKQTQAGVVTGRKNIDSAGADGTPKNTGAWGALVLLALVWIVGYWVLPLAFSGVGSIARPGFGTMAPGPRFGGLLGPLATSPLAIRDGSWGAAFALIALILMAGMLWRLVDVVSLEWTIANYGRGKPEVRAAPAAATDAAEPQVAGTNHHE
jgi:hypothetical protein